MRATMMGLLAAAALLAGCDRPAEPGAEMRLADGAAPEDLAEPLFAETCMGLNGSEEVCACVRGRVLDESGTDGLGYIGAAFGSYPELAAPYEAAMSQAERNAAAEAFLDGQFECVIAAGGLAGGPDIPDLSLAFGNGALDGAPADAESPFESAVAACVEAVAAPEPECRCRVQSVFEALGEDGLRLSQAADSGDEADLVALGQARGEAWLAEGAGLLSAARAACAP